MAWSLRAAVAILASVLLTPLALAQDRIAQTNPAQAPAGAMTQGFSADQTREIETIVRNYLVQHPEVLQDAMEALDKRQKEADAEKARTTVVGEEVVVGAVGLDELRAKIKSERK